MKMKKTPTTISISNLKSSYTNLLEAHPPSSAKKDDSYFRQSRFESMIRPLRDSKEAICATEHSFSSSISPEKKVKRPVGNYTLRSKSEFGRSKKEIGSTVDKYIEMADLKVIDSMEIIDNDEEDPQCEIDKEETTVPNQKTGKKKKGYTALSEMVPLNLDEERLRFFERDCKYNPQFEYSNQGFKQQFDKPHTKYLKVAKMILNACISEYGTDENFFEKTGGRVITKEETETYFENYIQEHGLEGCLDIIFSEKTVAPTSVIHDPTGKSRVVISLPIAYRENTIMGVMHHEIGTHYIRKYNDRLQPWFKNRKKYDLKPYLIIEEGLAALNQTLQTTGGVRRPPYLFNAALHYYSCYMSSILGFEALFNDLEKYIKNASKRWKECVRVKRGIIDTSRSGGMYKDQVYLRGAIEILHKRKKLDFVQLHSGKINVKDLQRLTKMGVIKTEGLKLPTFIKDLEQYKAGMNHIAETNFIDTIK